VDELARRWSAPVESYDRRFSGLTGQAQVRSETVLLLKPAKFMNLSGESVGAAWRYYKLGLGDLLVIFDDLDLPVGQLRLRPRGSAGGHKGMSDVIRHVGSDDIARLRIGIGKVHRDATVEYVLSRFDPDERPVVEEAVAAAADATETWIHEGIDAAMNRFNRRKDGE
jgi:PTH1 family peptidyl-tRNA hydrolase